MTLHIVTLNIKASNNPFAAQSFINSYAQKHAYDPVVFCLQELDVNAKRSSCVDVPALLAGDNDYRFAPTFSLAADQTTLTKLQDKAPRRWDYRIGMIVRNAHIAASYTAPLDPTEDAFWTKSTQPDNFCWECEPRAALFAKVTFTNASGYPENVWVANTHLGHKSNRSLASEFRAAQIETLLKAKKNFVPALVPFVLTGDFNATPNDPDLDPIHAHLHFADVKEPTKITKTGNVQVDHVFYENIRPLERPQVLTTGFSDHKAVVARFALG